MNRTFINLLLRWLGLALGVAIAARIVPGIAYSGWDTLIVVAVLLSFCNAVLRPVLLLFTLPLVILSLGFGVVLINALLFLLVGKIVEGFQVAGFWPALGGSIIVSLTGLLMNVLLREHPARRPGAPPRKGRGRDDVIDI